MRSEYGRVLTATTLPGYSILEPISSGAMGAVYRGMSEDGHEVALKRLLDKRHAARFEIEARLLRRLRHPRVVRVLDHVKAPDGQWLVMELVEGHDLSRVLREHGPTGLPVDVAVRCALEACEALEYVHAQQVVHRDVKPQNLILGEQGVVLVDFGVARELDTTSQGTAIGTPRYMAPEVLSGSAPSPRSDVFSLAATLWTLLTGAPPPYGGRIDLRAVVPAAPGSVDRAIRGGLEMDPSRRIASAAAFADALDSPLETSAGDTLAVSLPRAEASSALLQAIVRTAAGVFGAAAASLALPEPDGDGLVYASSWGAGADEIVGHQLQAGQGIAGAVFESRTPLAVADCRSDPRFLAQVAQGTGYVPFTMLTVPLVLGGRSRGVLQILDRRDGTPFGVEDIPHAELFAELALAALG